MKRLMLGVALILLGAGVASAQTPGAVTGAVLEIRQNGTPTGREMPSTIATQWTCDLAPVTVPSAPLVNPTKVRVNDPTRPGRECEMDITAFIRGLPEGQNYTGWMWAVSDQIQPPDNRSLTAIQVIPTFSTAPIYTRPVAFTKAYFPQ